MMHFSPFHGQCRASSAQISTTTTNCNLRATCTVVWLIRRTESVSIIADPVQCLPLELQLCSILFYVCVLLFIRKTLQHCTVDKRP